MARKLLPFQSSLPPLLLPPLHHFTLGLPHPIFFKNNFTEIHLQTRKFKEHTSIVSSIFTDQYDHNHNQLKTLQRKTLTPQLSLPVALPPSLWLPLIYFLVSIDLPVLDTTYKWNHIILSSRSFRVHSLLPLVQPFVLDYF